MQVNKEDILDLDMSTEDGSQLKIEAINVLDYCENPLPYLQILLKKLRYGGELLLEGNNLDLIMVALQYGEIKDINSVLYSGCKSIIPMNDIIMYIENAGFKIESVQQANYKYSLKVRRPDGHSPNKL